jgi:hypothetical protein
MLKIWFFSLISFSLASFACADKLNHKEIPMTFMAKTYQCLNQPTRGSGL